MMPRATEKTDTISVCTDETPSGIKLVAKSAVTNGKNRTASPQAGRPFRVGVRLEAALAVLQSVGTLEPEPIGETDPKEGRIR